MEPKEIKFEVGDTVRSIYPNNKGEVGTVVAISGPETFVIKGFTHGVTHELGHSYSKKYLELVSKKKRRGRPARVLPIQFLLKYDLDQDPIEEFTNIVDLKKRVHALLKDKTNNGLKVDSIYVYKIKSKSKVTIENSLSITKVK